jgi:hypothetical protein
MRRFLFCVALLTGLVARAQTFGGSGASSSGVAANCPSCDLVDATLTLSGTFTSNVASSGHAIDITQGARIYSAGTGYYLEFNAAGVQMTPGQAFRADLYKAATNDTTISVGGSKADGAAAVSVAVDSVVSFSTSGAKLLSVRNAAVRRRTWTRTAW